MVIQTCNLSSDIIEFGRYDVYVKVYKVLNFGIDRSKQCRLRSD